MLLSPSENLVNVQRNEKPRCNLLFEREARREKILEARQRELKLKERERSGKGPREDEEKRKFLQEFLVIFSKKYLLIFMNRQGQKYQTAT